jgi:hypothetical protein
MKMFLKSFLFFVLVCMLAHGYSQTSSENRIDLQDSRNGYILPVSGHIHILVVFAEVIYDTGKDPCPPEGTNGWRAGRLPSWKDNLFDPYPSDKPQAIISKFFHETSFGNYTVTGDYLINPTNPDQPVQILASENVSTSRILTTASEFLSFSTKSNFSFSDFDRWTMTHTGHAKQTPSMDSPLRFDHVMVIIRNSNYPSNLSGWTSTRSGGRLFNYENDTYSFFCTHEYLPLHILIHEFSHMLFGGTNFHAGGSHSKKAGHSYFLPLQGGWGMMGAAGKSFLTVNAWERRRLGWKLPGKNFDISCLDSTGIHEVNADLDAIRPGQQGIYLIRDFQTTGDAIRIRLPHLPDNVFPQWLWIENHQTKRFNNSEFDVFQYEYNECVDNALPGLYMYMQVDKEEITGREIFSGYADYLRPVPANGMYDFQYGDTTVRNTCVNALHYYPHVFHKKFQNPFSGNHELEWLFIPALVKGERITPDSYVPPVIRKSGNRYVANLPNNGTADTPFRTGGNTRIGIGTNPSTAPMITNVSANNELFGGGRPNNRVIFLNGISVEILPFETPVKGAMYVRIRFDDFTVREEMRWCADTIILPETKMLTIYPGIRLHIDRGLTPTKMTNPEKINNQLTFTHPTIFILEPNTTLRLEKRSQLIIDNGSQFIISPGAKVIMEKGSAVIVRRNSKLIVNDPDGIVREKRTRIKFKL